jgi:DNA-binding transcriptional ArsR family regulator
MSLVQVTKCSTTVVQWRSMGTLIIDTKQRVEAAVSGAEPLSHPERAEIELAAVLHALSDPMRLRIVAKLARGDERTCKSFELPVVKSTCTHHFRVLREAGVIRQRLEGTTRLNSLRHEDLEARFPGVIDSVLRAAGA